MTASEPDNAQLMADDNRGWTSQLVFTTLFLAMVLETLALGASMVSIGLPSILAEFPTDQGGWLLTTYYLAGAVAAPLLGKLADIYGKRKILLLTLVASCTGTLICALSVSFPMLIAGRTLQGLIMATISLSYSLIRDVFPPKPAAIAASITVTGMGAFSIVAPSLIGWLLDTWGFRGMFWFDLAWMGSLTLAIFLVTPESPLRRKATPDLVGAGLLALGVVPLLVWVSMSLTWGWLSPMGIGLVLLGVVSLTLFFRHTRRVADPIVNLSLFRRKQLQFVTITGATGYALGATAGTILPMMAMAPKGVDGYGLGLSTTQYSWVGTPNALLSVIAGVVLGTLVSRGRHPQIFMASSMFLFPFGLVLLAFRNDTLFDVLLAALILGAALGFANGSVPNLVIRATPADDQGSTSGTIQLCQTGFGAITPVLMFALLSRYATISPEGGVHYSEDGFQACLLIAAAFTAGVFVLARTKLWDRSSTPATAAPTMQPADQPRIDR
ncbi:MFS transporter [Rhodococcus fascians]|nr:MFS transporter [Rhodococcus fascians]MBY4140962.1 MFS transporter [Rhodococcus fascians]MBY4219626.1 MFS transporter [Rhodococcus fascians]MBY4221935.1 MFS transporter [Rhodococcus fascians]MBY4233936.1 MFS transporter [Rhodococcus fascians]